MQTRQTRSQTREHSSSHIVAPTDSVPEKYHFGSASEWGREELLRLGVDFDLDPALSIDDLVQHMGWKEEKWSAELKKSLLPSGFL